MGCCCLDHRTPIAYFTMAKANLDDGVIVARYDAMHPIIGDAAGTGTDGGTVAISGTNVIHSVIEGAFGGSVLVTTCFDVDNLPSVIWTRREVMAGSNIETYAYADETYVWVATNLGYAYCYRVTDGELQGSATSLKGMAAITSGTAAGLCQFGHMAEYDHEYTVIQSTTIGGTYRQSYSSATQHIAYHGNKIYVVEKDDLSTSTEIGSTGFATITLTYFDGDYYYLRDDSLSFETTSYDTAGNLNWSFSGPRESFYTHDDQGFVYSGSDGTKKRSRTDGSLSWHRTGAANGASRNRGGVDNNLDHVISGGSTFIKQSDGTIEYSSSGFTSGGLNFVIGDYWWTTGSRAVLP